MTITTTEYHPQTNSQAERSNSTISPRLRYYLSENQIDRDIHLLPLMYTYYIHVHRSFKVSQFSLVFTRIPPGSAAAIPKRHFLASEDYAASQLYARLESIQYPTSSHNGADKNLK